MREELIALLEKAFETGIITSPIQSQIDAIKKKINLPDAEYQQIEDQIRLDAYVRKVKERESKGITFMGDLRKQYKITEDDKILIQEKLKSEPKKSPPAKIPEPEAAPHSDTVKKSETPKQRELTHTPEPPKKQDSTAGIDSDVMKRSELLKQHAQMPEPASAKKTEPLKKPTPSVPREPSPPAANSPVILVADDNDAQLFIMKKIIETNGYTCITTDSPEAAVRIVSEKKPAIIFCDVNFGIGKPTGMDVYTNLRTKNIPIPFILVSAFFQREFKEQAKRIGITDYLTKPVDEDHLIATIKKYLAR